MAKVYAALMGFPWRQEQHLRIEASARRNKSVCVRFPFVQCHIVMLLKDAIVQPCHLKLLEKNHKI